MQTRSTRRRCRWSALLAIALVVHLCACGTLLYPDRHGQARGGQMDPAVVVMDGVLLILFIVPGLVAFVIDFHTGAIYLPSGRRARVVPADAQPLTLANPDRETLVYWLGSVPEPLHVAAMLSDLS
jgi:hypothetical protein